MKDISGTLRHCGRVMSNFQLSDIHGATFKTKRKRDTSSASVIGSYSLTLATSMSVLRACTSPVASILEWPSSSTELITGSRR